METVKYCSPGVFSYTAFFTVNMLQDMLNQHEVLQYLSGNKIRCTFNVWRRPLVGWNIRTHDQVHKEVCTQDRVG